MDDGEPVTQQQCASLHSGIADSLDGIGKKLDTLNGSVAENSKFRVESSAIFRLLMLGWLSLIAPLTAILVAVLK